MNFVTIGAPGNGADPRTGVGAVSYRYEIGKYEVTNAQYAEFLNSKAKADPYYLWNGSMQGAGIDRSGSSGNFSYTVTEGRENHPVAWVTWFDAARFANWLANGQAQGDTESGSYELNGATSGNNFPRTAGATICLPSRDEWYKAAYYASASDSYSRYPTASNSITVDDANYDNSVGSTTAIGSYPGDASFSGTFDQGGNVQEWTEEVSGSTGASRRQYGGNFSTGEAALSSDSSGNGSVPTFSSNFVGFRLVSIPEPSSLALVLFSGAVLVRRRR